MTIIIGNKARSTTASLAGSRTTDPPRQPERVEGDDIEAGRGLDSWETEQLPHFPLLEAQDEPRLEGPNLGEIMATYTAAPIWDKSLIVHTYRPLNPQFARHSGFITTLTGPPA